MKKLNIYKADLVLTVLIVAIIAQAVGSFDRFFEGRIWDWGHFFYAAEALSQGLNPFESGEGGYIYPVTFAWLLQPILILGFEVSAALWIALMAAALIGSLLIMRSEFLQQGGAPWVVLGGVSLGAVVVADKIVSTLKNAQTDGLLVLCLIGALALIRKRPILAGVLIALAAALKYHALLFLILFLIRRRWSAAVSVVVGFGVLLLLPAFTVGWGENLSYVRQAFAGVFNMLSGQEMVRGADASLDAAAIAPLSWERSISALSAAARLAEALPGPIALTPYFGLAISAGLAGWIAARGYEANGVRAFGPASAAQNDRRRRAADICDWSIVLTAMIVFSPQSTARHFIYALLPLAVIALVMFQTTDRWIRWILAGALVSFLLALNMPLSEYPALMDAWRAFSTPSWILLAIAAFTPALFLSCHQSGIAPRS